MVKSLLRALLRTAGLQRVVQRPDLYSFLAQHHVTLVADVGANVGQFGKDLRDRGYAGKIISFEPIGTVAAELNVAAANDSHWFVLNNAVGAHKGEAIINVSEFSVYSSIKPISTTGSEFDSRTATSRTETVSVVTLSDALQEHLPATLFIKIDTQGFEREVLHGSAAILHHCVGLQIELPVEHLYKNVWSFSDAIVHLDSLGFVPAQFEMVNTLRNDPSSGIEFDGVFRRKSS